MKKGFFRALLVKGPWGHPQIHRLIRLSRLKPAGYGVFLITSKRLDARRRGATTEAYGAIRRKGGAIEGNAADDALLVIRASNLA
jgi:hypothetical protein